MLNNTLSIILITIFLFACNKVERKIEHRVYDSQESMLKDIQDLIIALDTLNESSIYEYFIEVERIKQFAQDSSHLLNSEYKEAITKLQQEDFNNQNLANYYDIIMPSLERDIRFNKLVFIDVSIQKEQNYDRIVNQKAIILAESENYECHFIIRFVKFADQFYVFELKLDKIIDISNREKANCKTLDFISDK